MRIVTWRVIRLAVAAMRLAVGATILLAPSYAMAAAHSFSGTWQFTLDTKRVIKIIGMPHGYRGEYYDLGQGDPTAELISHVDIKGATIKFTCDRELGTFNGTFTPDGESLVGVWQDSDTPHSRDIAAGWQTDRLDHRCVST